MDPLFDSSYENNTEMTFQIQVQVIALIQRKFFASVFLGSSVVEIRSFMYHSDKALKTLVKFSWEMCMKRSILLHTNFKYM